MCRTERYWLCNIAYLFARILLLALVFTPLYSVSYAADRNPLSTSGHVIIYYANLTPTASARDPNRKLFLSILEESGTNSASEIREALLLDLADAQPSVDRDLRALISVSKKLGAPLHVFTNETALKGLFVIFDPKRGILEYRKLPYEAPDQNDLLRYYPLARASYFAKALVAVSNEAGMRPMSGLLIVRTHGSPGMALMPRINRDFRHVERRLVLNQLDAVAHNDLALPDISLQGTDQGLFWETLAGVATSRDIRFPLVFLSSCESGVQTLGQALRIPNRVEKIAHSGNIGMSSALIDYASIFRDLPHNAPFDKAVEMLADGVSKQQLQTIYIDSPWSALRWPLAKYTGGAWFLIAGLLPLIAWAVWQIAGFRAVSLRNTKPSEVKVGTAR